MIAHYKICGPLQDRSDCGVRSRLSLNIGFSMTMKPTSSRCLITTSRSTSGLWIAGYIRQRRPIIQLHSSLRPSQQNRKVLTRSLSFHALFEFASHICKEHTLPCTKPFFPGHHRPGFLLVPILRLALAHGRPKWASLCRGARLFCMSVGLVW